MEAAYIDNRILYVDVFSTLVRPFENEHLRKLGESSIILVSLATNLKNLQDLLAFGSKLASRANHTIQTSIAPEKTPCKLDEIIEQITRQSPAVIFEHFIKDYLSMKRNKDHFEKQLDEGLTIPNLKEVSKYTKITLVLSSDKLDWIISASLLIKLLLEKCNIGLTDLEVPIIICKEFTEFVCTVSSNNTQFHPQIVCYTTETSKMHEALQAKPSTSPDSQQVTSPILLHCVGGVRKPSDLLESEQSVSKLPALADSCLKVSSFAQIAAKLELLDEIGLKGATLSNKNLCKVGIAFEPRKCRKMVCSTNALKDRYPVVYVPILLDGLTSVPQVDILLYKPKKPAHIKSLSDLLKDPVTTPDGTTTAASTIEHARVQRPQLSSPVSLQTQFADRRQALQLLSAVADRTTQKTGADGERVFVVCVPRTLDVDVVSAGAEALFETETPAQGWVVKPRRSDDHRLHVVFSEDGLRRACDMLLLNHQNGPDEAELSGAIAQPLVPHYGICVKLYVFFDHVYLDYRVSIPVSKDTQADMEDHLSLIEPSKSKVAEEKLKEYLAAGIVPSGIEHTLAEAMRNLFQVHIFGIDFIVEEKTGRVVLIDLNYAPGFKNLPDCNPMFEKIWSQIKMLQTV